MQNQLDLTGQVIIVTGGARGVGKGITERFLDAGADVVICGRSKPEELPSASGKSAVFTQCDVSDPEQIQACVAFTQERFGRLDVLVNNAGGTPVAPAATVSPRYSESVIRLNLIAPLNFCQAANTVMQTQETGGSIINIASVSAIRPSPGSAAYGAAKAGLVNLGASLAVEWAPKVRVNSLAVGLVQTELSHLHYGDEEALKKIGETVPLGRMAMPQDIGDVCLFFASSLSQYVSGVNLTVHGGGEMPGFLAAANADNHLINKES